MANNMTPRERVLAALDLKEVDRPPVVCVTQSATVDVMDAAKVYWPEAHTDAQKMVDLAIAVPKVLGFESVRFPYCLTIEAEVMGCIVDLGKQDRTPMIKKHVFSADANVIIPENIASLGRMKTVIEAVKIAKAKVGKEYPIVVGTAGPVTIAGHLVGAENLLLWMVTKPDAVHKYIDIATKIEKAYCTALAAAGADVITMSDPSSSTDMMSPASFDKYSKSGIKECFAEIGDTRTILHICGNTTKLLNHMIDTGVNGLSIEEKVSPQEAVKIVGGRAALVGNIGVVSPLLQGTPAECYEITKKVRQAGFNLIAPGCGLAARVPKANIEAMVRAAKE